MAEIDPVLIVSIVGGTLGSLLGAWFVNGYLAREFEKRKKKFEVKLERYTVVVENLQSLCETLAVAKEIGNLQRDALRGKLALKRTDHLDKLTRPGLPSMLMSVFSTVFKAILSVAAHTRIFNLWSRVIAVKRSVGLDVDEDNSEFTEFALKKSFAGTKENGTGNNQEQQKRVLEKLTVFSVDVLRCRGMLERNLKEAVYDIMVVGSVSLGYEILDFVESVNREVNAMDKEFVKLQEDWKSEIERITVVIAKDLEDTL